ncbi:MAG: hypothetical protein HUJ93_02325 [Bacteroidales bacterium]|nr:hypothetical protein [Bacteroidales bacterium]
MNIISRYLTAIAAATALASNIYGADNRPAVAIVIDKTTYEAVKPAVAEYAASLATDGKRGVLLTDNISHPDSIRMQLLKL